MTSERKRTCPECNGKREVIAPRGGSVDPSTGRRRDTTIICPVCAGHGRI